MDIYEYIKMDHRKVSKLFELFKTASTNKNKLEIISLINKELTLHAESEESTFYKTLIDHTKNEKLVLHAENEHTQIINKLHELENSENMENIDHKVSQLKALVEHHISIEENEMFSKAKKILNDNEAKILKEKMHDYKIKILFSEKIKNKEPA